MIVRDEVWEKIRHLFSEEDKQTLRHSMTTQMICPPGVLIDSSKLPPRLRKKLKSSLEEVK